MVDVLLTRGQGGDGEFVGMCTYILNQFSVHMQSRWNNDATK